MLRRVVEATKIDRPCVFRDHLKGRAEQQSLTRFSGRTIALFPLAGQAADRFDRRKVIGFSMFLQTLCLGMFCAWLAASAPSARPGAGPLYLLLLILGAARAFSSPALSAILPQMIGKDEFPRAVAASTSAFQICTILGPAIGGITYAISGPATFALATGLYFLAMMEARLLASERI